MQQLDNSQRAFCEASEDNIRLLAPAGCGKTLCLLHRCKYLASQKPDERIRFLIVTFTRAAEQELSARLSDDPEFASLKESAGKISVEVTTLNAWGWKRVRSKVSRPELITDRKMTYITMAKILQDTWKKYKYIREAIEKKKINKIEHRLMSIIDGFKSLGFDHIRHENFTGFLNHLNILYEQNLELRLREQFDELCKCKVLDEPLKNAFKTNDKDFNREIGESLLEFIYLKAKTNIEIRKILARECYNYFFKFWIKACSELEKRGMITMTDQKYIAFLDESKNIEDKNFLSGLQAYNHVFVDEFQDINPLDLNLVKAIVKRNQSKLTIVGDDDQAIFEWRGATPKYILNPARFFDLQFHTYKLEVNYRSPFNIVESSQRLIAKNHNRVEKNIRSANQAKAKIQFHRTENLRDALDIVHEIINQDPSKRQSASRIAIIGRKRSELIPYQVYFASEVKIPFYAAEDLQLFLSDTFDRLLSLLDIKINMKNHQSIRVSDILKLCDYIRKFPLHTDDKHSLRQFLYRSEINKLEQEEIIDIIERYPGPWKGSRKSSTVSLNVADALRKFVRAESVSAVLQSFQEKFIGLQRDFGKFSKADEDIFYTDPPFEQLVDYASSYGDNYHEFLDNIRSAQNTLVRTSDFGDECEGNPLDHTVHLMTAPRAKGKEFDVVVLLNVRKGTWPDRRAVLELEETKQLAESERRLFYVVFTRAKKKIVMLLGNSQDEDSPYIDELELPGQAGR